LKQYKTGGVAWLIKYCHMSGFVAKGRASHPYQVPSLAALSCITLQDRSVVLFCISIHIPLECHPEKK
jgi:hypothetical protein